MVVMTVVVGDIRPDPTRLVARPFIPGASRFGSDPKRLDLVIDRILSLANNDVDRLLNEVKTRNGSRFDDIESVWEANYEVAAQISDGLKNIVSADRRHLVGAYLTQGYAYEAAALTNPSIVPLEDGIGDSTRFVLTARAIGEGHISSIAFITGSIRHSQISLDARHPHASNGQRTFPPFEKDVFADQLADLGLAGPVSGRILTGLGDEFSGQELSEVLSKVSETEGQGDLLDTARRIHWLAASNYRVEFDSDMPISEHLLSPATPIESQGMEDARFVRFIDDDGSVVYYAPYTAFDGSVILPQLIETTDFHSFRITTLAGPAVHHKGMAIFPRRIGGDYMALSRHDNERTFLLRSDDVRTWPDAEVLLRPEMEWEIVQTGNCGSPIETDEGWLVITHGVGPMRRYVLGAVLLDLDEPSKVVARLHEPLLEPDPGAFGYVPDVVYSCGSMIHDDMLVLPFGFADYGIRIAVTPVRDLLDQMTWQ
jgi:predicted GH43/DUF377 family glycosyl hydrolase